jgi:hypothetical protein
MADDPLADTPVVILVVDAGTRIRRSSLGDDDLIVVIFVVFPPTMRPQGACWR